MYHKSTFRSVLWEIGAAVIRVKTAVEKVVQCLNAQIVQPQVVQMGTAELGKLARKHFAKYAIKQQRQ